MIDQQPAALFLSIAMAASGLVPHTAFAQDSAQPVALTLEQQTAVRCSAAFALVANGQANGDSQALRYPALAERGREYMVRSSARLMDEAGISREQVAALLQAEAQALREEGRLDSIMQPCLAVLEASGL